MEFHFVGLIYTTYRNLFLRITNNVIMVRNTSIFPNKLGLNFMKYLSLWIRFCLEIILVVTKICFSLDFIFLDRMKNYFCWNLISWIYPFFVKTQKSFYPRNGGLADFCEDGPVRWIQERMSFWISDSRPWFYKTIVMGYNKE